MCIGVGAPDGTSAASARSMDPAGDLVQVAADACDLPGPLVLNTAAGAVDGPQ